MNNLYLLYQKLYILLMCYAKKMDLEVQRVCTGFLEIRSFFCAIRVSGLLRAKCYCLGMF